jgi:DNA-binding transcriptional LysR family regulator
VDLTQLRYFLAVAEHGSISAAARAVDVKQPTLSVAIKGLEDELDTTLLLRDSRGTSLTASGRELRASSQEIFEIIERTRTRLSELEHEDVGEFTLGCNDSLGAYFLPGFMRRYLESAPRVRLSVHNAPSAEVRQAVIDKKIEFGICVNPEPHPDLVMTRLYRDGIELYVSAEEPPFERRVDALVRVRKGPLVAVRRIPQVRDLIARFESDEILPDRVVECGTLQVVRSLVAAGLGVGLLPRRVAQDAMGQPLQRLHRQLPGFPDTIWLIYRADLHRTRAFLRLKDALVAYGKTLQTGDPGEDSILPP